MLKLLLSRNQNTITQAILSRAVQSGEGCIVLVPEQYSHSMERELCKLGGDGVSLRVEVLTFSRLAQRVFQELGGSARTGLDKGGRLLLMHLALRRLSSELKVYRRSAEKVSFLSGLVATADECKSYCITPELLLEAAQTSGDAAGQRLHELGLILSAYDALVAQRAEDPRDKLTRLAQTLKGSSYFHGREIYLDCFTDFTPQEKLILSTMLEQANSVTVGLHCEGLDDEGDAVFEPSRYTAYGLISLARQTHTGMGYEVLPSLGLTPEQQFLERHLFSGEKASWNGCSEYVHICKEKTPYSETERVAEEILRLVREEGCRFRDISVVARSMEGWEERLGTVFARYQIPVFLGRMDDILQKPIFSLILSALDTISGNYELDDIFAYLKSGLTGVDRERVDELENYALQWEIHGSRWTMDTPWTWHPDGYGQSWNEDAKVKVESLNALRLEIVSPLEKLRRCGVSEGGAWAREVYGFLEDIELPACLSRRTAELLEQGHLQEAEEYRQVWDILVSALEQCADLLEGDSMSLADFTDLLRLVLSQYQVGSIPVSLDRVTCSDMARVSHATGKILFLVGADDESLPMVFQDTGLLTREDRALLSALGAETPLSADQRMDREMLLIYQCCTMPAQRLYLSYAAHAMDGAEKRPSFIIHRLEELFPDGTGSYVNNKVPSAIEPAVDRAAREGDEALLEGLAQLDGGASARRALSAMAEVRENLTPEAVDALYRGKVRLSASRMDKVKSCHYSYFLQYGLKAKARKTAGLDAPEAGTFVHYVLERVLIRAGELGGAAVLTDEQVLALSEEATQEYIRTVMGGLEDKTPRFRYLFRRLAQSAAQVVSHMVEELRASDFEPVAFELGFGDGEELPPVRLNVNGIQVSVSGFVDRVDGWTHDGKLYLRVLDYKTGKKSFDLTDVWHGLNLQMLLYLFTLQEKGLPGDGREIVPAGVLYLPAREESLSGSRTMEEQARRAALDKKLRRSGLILHDPNVIDAMEHIPLGSEARFLPVKVSKKTGAISGDCLASAVQLGKLRRHIHKILKDIAHEVGGGNIQADPWFKDERRTACAWCDYATACHFEEGRRGECSRYLYPVKGAEFWEQVDGEGGE